MFSDLTLYYLNQIGITPWINKERSSTLLNNSGQSDFIKLMIFVPADLSDKSQSLFNRMINYLDIESNELLIIKTQTRDLENAAQNAWYGQLKNNDSIALLDFGLNIKKTIDNLSLTNQIVQSLNIESLLTNPLFKKKVFQDLTYLKKLIS